MGNIIEAKNISKIYGIGEAEFRAIDDVSVNIKKGEFVGIMGPSGAGKSTLINLLTGIDKVSLGSVTINGNDISNMSEIDMAKIRYKNIGFVFQNFNLQNYMTIRENIILPAVLDKRDDTFIDTKLLEVAKLLGVDTILDKYPSECSGGQKQRAAVARSIMNEAEIIVADEPTGNLDSARGKAILDMFRRLSVEKGITVIMVTHDERFKGYFDRLLHIVDGKLG